jgi:hypothetical protein
MTLAIPAVGEIIVLSMEYAADGVSWVRLWDNHALGWLVDETLVEPPPADTRKQPVVTGQHAPFPLILGSLAVPPPDTTPIISPQWGKYTHSPSVVFIPDIARMELRDFLTWLATNNGARRPIGSMLALSVPLRNGYGTWAAANPSLAFTGDPPK